MSESTSSSTSGGASVGAEEHFPSLGPTYGAYLIGAIGAAILYGIIVSQVIFYFNRYPRDKTYLKLLVLVLFILDTLTVITETHGLYHYLIVHFADYEELLIQFWSVQLEPCFAYVIMFLVQVFFITRIWELSGRQWLLPSALMLLAFGALGTALAIVVKVFQFKFWSSSLLPYMKAMVTANKVLETAVDALITALLCYYLNQGRTGVKRTESMINKLIVFSINRGAITTFLQLCYLIAFLVKPDSMAWAAIHVAISKVYTNSVLATLNSRNAIRGSAEDTEILSVQVSTARFGRNPLVTAQSETAQNASATFSSGREVCGGQVKSHHGAARSSEDRPIELYISQKDERSFVAA